MAIDRQGNALSELCIRPRWAYAQMHLQIIAKACSCALRNPGTKYAELLLHRSWCSICTPQETSCELCLAMLMWAPPSAICLI